MLGVIIYAYIKIQWKSILTLNMNTIFNKKYKIYDLKSQTKPENIIYNP